MDDATSQLLPGATLAPAEATLVYLHLLRALVTRCGIPGAIYMDRHSLFRRNDDAWTVAEPLRGRQDPTHVGRALDTLGIQAIDALSPQAKGRIERLWGTLQDRLVAELRLAGISTLPAANRFLAGFCAPCNTRFARPAAETQPAWRPVSSESSTTAPQPPLKPRPVAPAPTASTIPTMPSASRAAWLTESAAGSTRASSRQLTLESDRS
jgi:hypothetical protein